jgi:hypothetical protein
LKSDIAQTSVFEQWIFLPADPCKQIYFTLKRGCGKTSGFAAAPFMFYANCIKTSYPV